MVNNATGAQAVANNIAIQPIKFVRDPAMLKSILSSYDGQRLDLVQPAIEQGNGFLFVAATESSVIVWIVNDGETGRTRTLNLVADNAALFP